MMRTALLIAAIVLACGTAFGQDDSSPEKPSQPAAHSSSTRLEDRHEGLSLRADSYSDPARAKDKFSKANPVRVGILPVEVFLHNETTQPIRVKLDTIQLVVHYEDGREQNVDWLAVGDVASTIAHPGGPPNPTRPRFPIGSSVGDKKAEKITEILQPFVLDADILPPLSTIHGFLFFDLGRSISLAGSATLYMPDVTNLPTNKPLMFFEVGLSHGPKEE